MVLIWKHTLFMIDINIWLRRLLLRRAADLFCADFVLKHPKKKAVLRTAFFRFLWLLVIVYAIMLCSSLCGGLPRAYVCVCSKEAV